MNPTTVQEMITLLSQIATEYGGDTSLEFQDYDWDKKQQVRILVENIVDFTDSSKSHKKLIIRDV